MSFKDHMVARIDRAQNAQSEIKAKADARKAQIGPNGIFIGPFDPGMEILRKVLPRKYKSTVQVQKVLDVMHRHVTWHSIRIELKDFSKWDPRTGKIQQYHFSDVDIEGVSAKGTPIKYRYKDYGPRSGYRQIKIGDDTRWSSFAEYGGQIEKAMKP